MTSPGALLTVVSGMPGMWRVARSEGDRWFAIRVLVGAALALVVASWQARGRPRTQNAIRHFIWSAWLTARFSEEVAQRLADEHEQHSLDPLDSQIDQRNNGVGRGYGVRHRDRILTPLGPVAMWRLGVAGTRQWRAGSLWCVRDGRIEASGSTRNR